MKPNLIVLRDPWREHFRDNDTGFGNRLMSYSIACVLRNKINKSAKIGIFKREFPEVEFLNIPHTVQLDENEYPIKLLECERITNSGANQMMKGTYNFNNEVYETDYTFDAINDIMRAGNHIGSIIRSISLKNNDLLNNIKAFSKDLIGIHIRRGRGVFVTKEDLKSIPSRYREYYPNNLYFDANGKNVWGNPVYRFVRDEEVFKLIDTLPSDKKYFVSSDIDEKAMECFKTRYKGRVLTRSNFMSKNKELLSSLNFFKPIINTTSTGYNLLDFYLLAYTKLIYQGCISTWSGCAAYVNSTKLHMIKKQKYKDVV